MRRYVAFPSHTPGRFGVCGRWKSVFIPWGGAVEFSGDQVALERCMQELEALAQWPRYTVADKLDLPYGHAVQLMATAFKEWAWLPPTTRHVLKDALLRAVEEGMARIPSAVQDLASPDALLAKPLPHQHLHNIPLIAQAALATAAEVIQHSARNSLSSRFRYLYLARLALHHQGLTEGISYDGYLHNFALGWLSTQPWSISDHIVKHAALQDLERQARGLACPGEVWQSAEIGDVEPQDMPFVWSALARLQHWDYSPSREALLDAVPPKRLRADALWARAQLVRPRHTGAEDQAHSLPAVQRSAAALTLSTGLDADDLSLVVSLCRSPMNHIQVDSGTLLIGHAGNWWITDPGYQQYLKTAEREYTLGACAHNTPVVNGHAQAHKAARLVHAGPEGVADKRGSAYALLDLTACYPSEAQVETVTRAVWRLGHDHVVVCDTVVTASDTRVAYHWHGHADAFWGEREGAIFLYQEANHRTLWIQAGGQPLSLKNQQRLRGSRGPCTLQVECPAEVRHHWWCFSFAEQLPYFRATSTSAHIGDVCLNLSDIYPEGGLPPPLTVQERQTVCGIPLLVSAQLSGNQITGSCELLPGVIDGAVEYAFYLLVNGQKSQIRWYEPSPIHTFTLSPNEADKSIQVRGFVRSVRTPEEKISATSSHLEEHLNNK